MSKHDLGYPVATTIAAANALVPFIKCGQFISRYKITGPRQRKSKLGQVVEYRVQAMTNTRCEIEMKCALVFARTRLRADFPIEKVIIEYLDPLRIPLYYEYSWDGRRNNGGMHLYCLASVSPH